jgi:phosphoglycolate phosphatase
MDKSHSTEIRDTYTETILFDLDGTLADTAPDLAYALNKLLQEEGRGALPYASIRNHVSRGGAAMVRLGFGEDLRKTAFEDLRARFLAIYGSNLCVKTQLFPGMSQVLDYIEANNMKWGVVTNKLAWMTEPLIEALGLTQRAACIVSGDTTDEQKPHPKPLLHACLSSRSSAQRCIYVGDDPRDIQAGNAAGMTTLVARYGYIDNSQSPEDWGANGIIDDVIELVDWLHPGPNSANGMRGENR